jgi:hypothetical protein
MINSFKAEKNNLLEKEYQGNMEHLFARVLVERSEEVGDLSLAELTFKIVANYGVAAIAIMKELFQDTDLAFFVDHNDIKNLYELSNHAKLSYADHSRRRRLLSDLGYKYFCTIAKRENPSAIGLEVLTYVADAIAFLAKNKIQFVEDFGCIFNITDAMASSDNGFGSAKYDLGKRLYNSAEGPRLESISVPGKSLGVRNFSAALQEAAYQDLTVGSYQANIPGWKSNIVTGFANEVGEKAYWDIFFWLRPGVWLRINLQRVTVIV